MLHIKSLKMAFRTTRQNKNQKKINTKLSLHMFWYNTTTAHALLEKLASKLCTKFH